MTLNAKLLYVAIPVVVGIGIGGAVVLDDERESPAVVVPAGTILVADLEQAVSADANRAGDEVRLRTAEPITIGSGVGVPAGTEIRGVVTRATSPDWGAGPPQLGLRFTTLVLGGDEYAISTEEYQFGTLEVPAAGRVVLPQGERLKIRLTRSVTID